MQAGKTIYHSITKGIAMLMEEVIEEIKRFVDNHDKTDYPMFVYYEPLKIDEKGNILKNTGFLTTLDKSILIKSNVPYVTFYGKIHISKWDMRVCLLEMVPLSEIKSIDTIVTQETITN